MRRGCAAGLAMLAMGAACAAQTPAKRPSVPMVPMAGMGAARPQAVGRPVNAALRMSPDAMDMAAMRRLMRPFFPGAVTLTPNRPDAIRREPRYAGTPMYGAVRLGSGPRSVTYFATDEPKGLPGAVYFDINQNGDLTDDGPAVWTKVSTEDGIASYERPVALHASWGDALNETESSPYTLFFYKRHGDPRVGYVRFSARTGSVPLAGAPVAVTLVENTSDAIFTVPRQGDRTRNPVWLIVERTGKDGGKVPEAVDIAAPFQLGGLWYQASPSISGADLTLAPVAGPTAPPSSSAAPHAQLPELLKAGSRAPDFVVQSPAGRPLRLSDFRGKTVILDFWATWCGPCMASMPGLEKLYQRVKSQNVVVLSVNVFDAKDPFDAWIEKNAGSKYNFTFGFDPAGRDQKTGVASSKYGVTGIPTLFVIDAKGAVAATVIGSGNEDAIVAALTRLGVRAAE